MRHSRKAGLLTTRGVRWFKYECEVTKEPVYRQEETDWEFVSSIGVDDGYSITGSRDYTYISPDGLRYFAGADGTITITAPNTGSVYRVTLGTTLERDSLVSDGAGGTNNEIHRKTLTNILVRYDTVYNIGAFIGSVRAAEGERPDAQNGYRYVGVSAGRIIIMQDGDGNYYAYTQTKPTFEVPSYTFSASIVDDVLVVTGDGSATIDDDVLVVTGGGSTSVENDILYVR